MFISKLRLSDINRTLDILKQDCLKHCDNTYPSYNRIKSLIINKNGISLGLHIQKNIISVALSERLIDNGCILWYIATDKNKQKSGYGTNLLHHFERYTKHIDIQWIFLNATPNSLQFYKNNGYITSEYSNVYEHIKYL